MVNKKKDSFLEFKNDLVKIFDYKGSGGVIGSKVLHGLGSR